MKLNDGRLAIPLLQDAAGQRVMEKNHGAWLRAISHIRQPK